MSLEDERVVGFEMLARRVLPDGLIIPPDQFIPEMERQGLLNELTAVLLTQGILTAGTWPEQQFLSVNVSPSQLKGCHLPDIIKHVANQYAFSLPRLKIEITETALIDDVDSARAQIDYLSEMGCMIAMDDFGTGFSSLAWLIQLPATTIKIDSSFIRSMLHQKDSRKIVSSVVGLGRSLDMDVIAEGVETEEEAEMLRKIGCTYAQGYLFGKPLTADETHALLLTRPGKNFIAGYNACLSISARIRSRPCTLRPGPPSVSSTRISGSWMPVRPSPNASAGNWTISSTVISMKSSLRRRINCYGFRISAKKGCLIRLMK
ncbi:EAL domain-containing protein [Pantoea stewartii]|uniref:EAL domain-containing protein n=1 Tax=Pantoea stewartii TaxID=66269 RepID=UPI0037045FC1